MQATLRYPALLAALLVAVAMPAAPRTMCLHADGTARTESGLDRCCLESSGGSSTASAAGITDGEVPCDGCADLVVPSAGRCQDHPASPEPPARLWPVGEILSSTPRHRPGQAALPPPWRPPPATEPAAQPALRI